ncbi:hypothetical protein UlMin_008665 [Ulmus minor]
MPDIQLGAHTVKSHGAKVLRVHMHDWLVLLLLGAINISLHAIEPFHRYIGRDMMSDLKFPFKEDTVPFWAVPIYAVFLPFVIFFMYYFCRKDVYDLHHASMGLLFSVLINGVITDAIKNAVGRPRPNFFWRCFPDGVAVFNRLTGDVICHGNKAIIKEGYKSFPSGHTSWSFAGLGFLAWYLSGKIRVFDRRGHAAKLCIFLLPLLLAALVGISRVDDYWHHWQDVFAGGLIGMTVASFCYLQAFPYPNDVNGWAPHIYFKMLADGNSSQSSLKRLTSLRLRPQEIESGLYENDKETPESSTSHSRLVMEALEAGRNY